ncbi:hypothetical protein BC835DRAFT_1554429 [Cytidiella melzeri]|nr:hypothetical protein BC835DRAFT_1554429 [Cytidiella melzeri]
MALTAYLVILVCLCRHGYAAPLDTEQANTTSEAPVLITQVVTSSIEVIETSTIVLPTTQQTQTPSPPAGDPSAPTFSLPQTSFTTSQPPPVTSLVTIIATSTPPPITITVTVPPAIVTQTITTTPASSSPPVASNAPQTAWSVPAQMTDLSSFNVSYFPYGQDNMAIVNATQPQVNASSLAVGALAATAGPTDPSPQSPPTTNGSFAALQLFYPAGSVNPESEPQGGADFYASPIDLSQAKNVTLQYSVFFPADFDWVLAGKLPGLYGGHSGCSGGNDALSCFSTRLMWRENGAGELYLYAPKDRQTDSLCSAPPQSVCDQEYGLSIGRGSFNFTPGAWTHVKQTVILNTPGGQDGGFVLEVDGQEAMRRADVFYRDAATASEPSDDIGNDGDGLDEDEPDNSDDNDEGGGDGDDNGEEGSGNDDPEQPPPSPPAPQPTAEPAPSLVDPGAVPILGPLLNGLRFRVMGSPHYVDFASGENVSQFLSLQARDDDVPLWLSGASSPAFILPPASQSDNATTVSITPTTTTTVVAEAVTQTISLQATSTAVVYVGVGSQTASGGGFAVQAQANPEPVGFSGRLFSSFFGGHEEKYASPKDQYTWFKDFAITIND